LGLFLVFTDGVFTDQEPAKRLVEDVDTVGGFRVERQHMLSMGCERDPEGLVIEAFADHEGSFGHTTFEGSYPSRNQGRRRLDRGRHVQGRC
jgi:hypothetical protein